MSPTSEVSPPVAGAGPHTSPPHTPSPHTPSLSALPLWQSGILMRPKPWLQLVGALALLTFGFFGISLDAVPEKAATLANLIGLAMLAIYGGPVNGVSLRRSTIVWLAVAAIGVAFISWMASWLLHPQWAEPSFKVHRLTAWFAMIPIAAILGGRARNVYLLWGLALAGLMTAPWISGAGLDEWRRGIAGERIDFGLHNAQHAAMLFGIAALGLLAFAPQILRKRSGAALYRLGWLTAVVFCIATVTMTQTRGVWAGLLAALAVVAACAIIVLRQRLKHRRRFIAVASIATCMSTLLIGYFFLGEIIQHRMEAEQQTFELVQRGNLENVPYTSTGIRLHTWAEGLRWFAQRPLAGWGGNGRSLVFEHSTELPEDIKQNFGHLHNSYLDLLVNFGILGALLLAALAYWLVSRCLRSYRSGLISGSNLAFCLSFTVFFGVINCFESYLFYDSGRLAMAIVGGGILTQLWAAKRHTAARHESS